LTVKTLTSTQTPKSNEKTTNEGKLLLLYITLPILIIAVLIALLIFVKKKRPRSDKKHENNVDSESERVQNTAR